MSDIAERLRNRAHSHQAGCEICEAADEIDQLRFERDAARAELHQTYAEIERLKGLLHKWYVWGGHEADDLSEETRDALEGKP